MGTHYAIQYNGDLSCINNDTINIEFAEQYKDNATMFNYHSCMNMVSEYIESELSPLKKQAKLVNNDIVKMMKTNEDPLDDYEKINYIKELSDEYYDQKEKFRQGINNEFSNIDQVAKSLREKSLDHFENGEELANYVIEVCYIQRYHHSKSFAWNVFGKFLLDNLSKNTESPATIPVIDKDGNVDYLFRKYSLKEVEVNES